MIGSIFGKRSERFQHCLRKNHWKLNQGPLARATALGILAQVSLHVLSVHVDLMFHVISLLYKLLQKLYKIQSQMWIVTVFLKFLFLKSPKSFRLRKCNFSKNPNLPVCWRIWRLSTGFKAWGISPIWSHWDVCCYSCTSWKEPAIRSFAIFSPYGPAERHEI